MPTVILIILAQNRSICPYIKRITPYYFIFFCFSIAIMGGGVRSITNNVLFIVPFLSYVYNINIYLSSFVILFGYTTLVIIWMIPSMDSWIMTLNMYPMDALLNATPTYIIMYYIVFIAFWGFSIMYDKENKKYKKIIEEKTLSLERSNKIIKNEAQRKTSLFVNLAHETKTPLTLIRSYLEKYIQEYGANEQIEIIKKNIDKLTNDMVNFLDAEKIEQGRIKYDEIMYIDFSNYLHQKIILFKNIAIKKNITILDKIEPEIIIFFDSSALDRIINNLIDNAIRYTNDRGSITIELKKILEDKILFAVDDNGPGIPEEQQPYIFDKYYQISKHKSNIQGMGIGLYITKSIVDQYKGDIHFSSIPGKGTRFEIIINSNIKAAVGTPTNEIFISTPVDTIPVLQKLESTKRDPNKKTLLFIEDHLDLLYSFHEEFSEKYNVILAMNGREGFQYLKKKQAIDLIVSDIMMDFMDGYEFRNKVLEFKEYKSVPFIFLSAITDKDDKLKGLSQGAVDFICKPFSWNELKEKIKSWLLLLDLKFARNDADLKVEYQRRLHDFITKFKISSREAEVLGLLLRGYNNKMIAEKLFISMHTVKKHIERTRIKLEIPQKQEFVKFLFEYIYGHD